MSARSLAAVERKLLARLPDRSADPKRIAEFAESFGQTCTAAADAVVLMGDIIRPSNLSDYAEKLAAVVVDGIDTAAREMGVPRNEWVRQGQRWAAERFFARIAEVRGLLVQGGRA